MPRKPNYRMERSERMRAKAAKKAKRLEAQAEKTAARKEQPDTEEPGAGTDVEDSKE